ncbi:odorant receptor 85b isoform X2 [Ooceraea biroi]|nr:odorant receptor 85b isoform X2 [Ooceraea biroi]XP_011348438.1 odorant receptor 85b isoform X2 [Ooceraea biroi]XP_011348440.1 odorant receptor 85b isoform X2 [Ooceraea biroi]
MHCGSRRRMTICLKTQHFNLNRILLLLVGLWPYEQSKLVHLQLILFFGILSSSVIFQLTVFLTAQFTIDLVVQVLSVVSLNVTFMITYNAFWANTHTVRLLGEQLQHMCNELRDGNEIAIIQKYGNDAKRITIIFIFLLVCYVISFNMLSFMPYFLSAILHINESNHPMQLFLTEYFVDEEKYFYLILLHTNVAFSIGGTAFAATGLMLLSYVEHSCGMFQIASYRLEKALGNVLENISAEKEMMQYRQIVYAITIHRDAMEFSTLFISNFGNSFFGVAVVGVLCMSLNFFGISRTLLHKEHFMQLAKHFIIAFSIVMYIFLSNYFGQQVTDHDNHVYLTAYNVYWYKAPIRIQKLILFLIERSTKSFNLRVVGVLVASIERFASLMKTSISYFTVIHSLQ